MYAFQQVDPVCAILQYLHMHNYIYMLILGFKQLVDQHLIYFIFSFFLPPLFFRGFFYEGEFTPQLEEGDIERITAAAKVRGFRCRREGAGCVNTRCVFGGGYNGDMLCK